MAYAASLKQAGGFWKLESYCRQQARLFTGEDGGAHSVAAVRKGFICHVVTGLLFTAMGPSSHRMYALTISALARACAAHR